MLNLKNEFSLATPNRDWFCGDMKISLWQVVVRVRWRILFHFSFFSFQLVGSVRTWHVYSAVAAIDYIDFRSQLKRVAKINSLTKHLAMYFLNTCHEVTKSGHKRLFQFILTFLSIFICYTNFQKLSIQILNFIILLRFYFFVGFCPN